MQITITPPLAPEDRLFLEDAAEGGALAHRARIVLLAAEGMAVKDIVTTLGVSKPTVILWRKRYAAEGVAGLADRPKPGRPRRVRPVP
ncbi:MULTISPECIES: helix-turn-helix domain-containing protein [unclassified Amycolatopsis]|uniref:helix-turn-helix domain-containing protein n=1 Tax=unclassified Amycolatopsis TaxID=2618356 RepID=UPI00352572F6